MICSIDHGVAVMINERDIADRDLSKSGLFSLKPETSFLLVTEAPTRPGKAASKAFLFLILCTSVW